MEFNKQQLGEPGLFGIGCQSGSNPCGWGETNSLAYGLLTANGTALKINALGIRMYQLGRVNFG